MLLCILEYTHSLSSRLPSPGDVGIGRRPTQPPLLTSMNTIADLRPQQGVTTSEKDSRFVGLRQRPNASRIASSEKLFESDVEMVQLDQANPLITYTPMTPTYSRPSSRAQTPTSPFDIDPFGEPSVPVASAIPLPLSPSSSIMTDRKRTDSPGYVKPDSRASSGVQPFSANTRGPAPTPSLSTPNLASPSSQAQPHSPFSTIRRSRNQPSASQASIVSASILSPTAVTASTDAKSPIARATSPSGMSDTLSLVSATPSRTWTDGGTAEIFSGDERDFQEAEPESDDDVRSVSESGSWESVSAAARGEGQSLASSGRLARR